MSGNGSDDDDDEKEKEDERYEVVWYMSNGGDKYHSTLTRLILL